MIQRQQITDKRGRTLVVERDIIEIRERGPNEHIVDGGPLDGPVVGRFCRSETVTIDGEPASKRRVGQFIRRARESMEKR
ncbi:MAG: hypothetical protein WC565_07990 [Parcubacteria group bacterium]